MSWIGAAASAIGSLFGLGGNLFQSDQANKWNQKQLDAQLAENQKNRDFNHSEAEIARNFQADFAREMFDKTNKYNSMSNQVAQLKQAGLNPALMYSGSSFAPGSMPSVSAGGASSSGNVSPTQYSTTDMAGPALSIARQRAEIANIEASTEKIRNESSIFASDAAFRDAWNEGQLVLQGLTIDLSELDKGLKEADISKRRMETKRLEQDYSAFTKHIQMLDTQIESGRLDNVIKRVESQFKTKEFEERLSNLAASTALSKAQIYSIVSKVPYEIKALGADAAYKNALSSLCEKQGLVYDAQANTLKAQEGLFSAQEASVSVDSATKSRRESHKSYGGFYDFLDLLSTLGH